MAEILLVEDDDKIARMMMLRLQLGGHSIDWVPNGLNGVDAALEGEYDLVLMDMHMPIMDGHEATRRLREAGYAGLIHAVTASAMSEDSRKAIAAGCDGFIPKPIGEDFEALILQALAAA